MSEERPELEPGDEPDDLDSLEDLEEQEPEEEPEDEVEEEAEPAEPAEPEPPRRQSRETARVRALRERTRQAEERERQTRSQLDQLTQQVLQTRASPPPVDPYRQAEADRLERERVAALPFEDQIQYHVERRLQPIRQQQVNDQVALTDRLDRQAFDAFKARHPLAMRYESQVETALASLRQQNLNPTREAVLKYLAGDEVFRKAERQMERQRRVGRRRIASQTTRPTRGRSTVLAERRQRQEQDNSPEAIERRWGDTPL